MLTSIIHVYISDLHIYRSQNDAMETIHAKLIGVEMGTNDLYLIKKLKESGVTLERMNMYAHKIKMACKEINYK
jgi:hypothetical protein